MTKITWTMLAWGIATGLGLVGCGEADDDLGDGAAGGAASGAGGSGATGGEALTGGAPLTGGAAPTGGAGTGGAASGGGIPGANCGVGAPVPDNYDPGVACEDVPVPGDTSRCADQALWGKCSESWMVGYCLASCGVCGLPPPPFPACGACSATFSSGVNLAWVNFAGDIPNPNLGELETVFTNVAASGGPFVRWWFHVNGSVTPGYGADGMTLPIADRHIADVVKLLNEADESGAQIIMTLWSFDMLQGGQYHPNGEAADIAASTALLTDDVARQAYIDNYLTPLFAAIKGHPALYAIDLFNEPEGMSVEFGWTPNEVPMASIQRTANWLSDAIHTEWPEARVTVGSWSFQASSDVGAFTNYYSDAALVAAGGRALGTLDFYQVHYYTHLGAAASPFTHAASYWELEKPVVIGEFWTQDTDGVLVDDLYTNLYDSGYAGAWSWQYYDVDGTDGGEVDNTWPKMQPGMEALSTAHPAEVSLTCQ